MPHALPRHRIHDDAFWAAGTLSIAVLATVLALAGAFDLGAVLGLVALLAGGWSQLVSETRFERWESVTGAVLGAVVLGVCLAYGSGVGLGQLPTWTGVT